MISVGNLIAVGAGLVAVISLFVSIAAYRQRARYHPQAKLVVEWRTRLDPKSGTGLFFRTCTVYNYGDEPARDLRAEVSSGSGVNGRPWYHKDSLEPTEHVSFAVPVIGDVSKASNGQGGWNYTHPGQDHYKFVTPRVTLRWRQPPFSGRPRQVRSRAPHTPNMLAGETS